MDNQIFNCCRPPTTNFRIKCCYPDVAFNIIQCLMMIVLVCTSKLYVPIRACGSQNLLAPLENVHVLF